MLKEIIEKCSRLKVDESRSVAEDYAELVFFNKEISEWNKILVDALGPAIKPAGTEPTEEDLRLTEDYGGIHDSQTLFKKEFDGFTVIAMFWPWQDNEHTTLKMAALKK